MRIETIKDHPNPDRPRAVFQWEGGARRRWLAFSSPREILEARLPGEVPALLERVERHARRGGWAVGYIAYEAAPAFDTAFRVRPAGDLPPARFELYPGASEILSPFGLPHAGFKLDRWRADLDRSRYEETVKRIKRLIADGETYQVNYTFRLRADFQGDPLSLWLKLLSAQPGGRPSFIDAGGFAFLSATPEVFFHRNESGEILCRPMKGTARRGLTLREDIAAIRRLAASKKDRAENLMIVDMIRNDLAKIAPPGEVKTRELFSVEKHPTLLQMTSTVSASTPAPLAEIMAALFPCASITGAPKIRATEIIAGMETSPRGIYTGTIGAVAPGGAAQFNVAIRTVTADLDRGRAVYGTGGGIVWDSRPRAEYSEAILKSSILTAARPEFDLLATIRWDKKTGYFLLEGHLRRLAESGEYFDFPIETERIRSALNAYSSSFPAAPRMVRLRLDRRGKLRLENHPLPPREKPWKLAAARRPVNPRDCFLYHKTTRREVYDRARAERPGYDDVILFNRRGEVTETTRANIVAQIGGELLTPPVKCGLLGGVFRARLLERGTIRERKITFDELRSCRQIRLINSVRKWIPVFDEISC